MSELKPGWKKVKFGEVVRLNKDTSNDPLADGLDRYVGLEHLTPGDLQIRSWGDVADGITFTSRFRPGHVLFGKRRAYQRKIAVADFEGVCSGDIYVFESKDPNVLLPDLLPFICQTDAFFDHAIGTSAGSLSPRTNWTSLAKYEFALPPLAEQRRLTLILSSYINTIEALRTAQISSSNLEFSLLLSEFGTLEFPTSKTVSLAQVAYVQTGAAKGRSSDENTIDVPYLRVANVLNGTLNLEEIKLITIQTKDFERYLLRPGDVLMTEGGDLDKLGRGTVWQEEIKDCIHQNHVFAVRTNIDTLLPWYLAALNRSIYGRQYFSKRAKRTSNLASINKNDIQNLPVPIRTIQQQYDFLERWHEIKSANTNITKRIEITNHALKHFFAQALT